MVQPNNQNYDYQNTYYDENGQQQQQQYDPQNQQQQQQYYDPNQQQQQQQYYDPSQQQQQQPYTGDPNGQQYYDQNAQQQQYQTPSQGQQLAASAQSQVQASVDMNTSQYLPGNDGEIELHVGDAVEVKGTIASHHAYPIVGRDSIGEIECSRRFQNFFDFRQMLCNRFPGLYIPPVPKKTTTNNKDESTVRERRYFLDLFLKECTSLKYLAASKELQIFLRPQGDLNSLMQKQYRPKLVDILTTFRATLPVVEDFAERDISVFSEEVTRFANEQKNLNIHLQQFRKTLKNIVPIKEQERQYYHQFSNFLERYEEGRGQGGSEGVGALAHVRLITGDRNVALKDKLEVMTQQHSNPFVHINHWVKGEVWCLEALQEAIAQKDAVDGRKKDCENEIASMTDTINKLHAGKFTFGSMLKSSDAKKESAVAKETARSELQKDVLLYDTLKKYLTIYLATVAIPNYKRQRIESYVRAMGRMSDAEVRNSENTYDCWNNFQKTIISYNIKY